MLTKIQPSGWYIDPGMRKQELARELARKTGVSRAEAADQVDRLVNEILQKIRQGEPAKLPGMGELRRDCTGRIGFLKDSDFEQA